MHESRSLMTTITKFKFIIYNIEDNLQLLESTKSDTSLPVMLIGQRLKINNIKYEIILVEHNIIDKSNTGVFLTVYNVIPVD
ncbi:hypothetical protein [Bacillus sp. GM_Baccil_2]|uniref:hypothetical protein n=1 Tax=Bacillus sp. GM_Baccil_2 TaxID=2937369 RepID=UPI00226A9164